MTCYYIPDVKTLQILSLHFVPILQSAVYIVYPVCSLLSAFCTNRYPWHQYSIFLVRPSQFNVLFPIALPLVRVGRSVGQKKKKRERTLERAWVPGKAGLLSTKAWLQSQLENVVPSFDILYLQWQTVTHVRL